MAQRLPGCNQMPIAALYSRVSTSSEDQRQALAQQQARLAAAVPEGFTIAEYCDVQSGKDIDRPAFNRLMADVRRGAVDLVVATRLDRLSRNRRHGAELLDTFAADGAPRLHLLDDHLDLGTVGGRLMAGILSAWAVAESERLGERTAHGFAHRRKLGKPFGPAAPQGYRWTPERDNYELDPDTADLCRQTLHRLQEVGQIRPVMRWAMEQGLRFGSPSAFTRWASNPALAGARVYGVSTTKVVDGRRVRRHNPPGVYAEVHWDAHPPLITREHHAWLLAFFEQRKASVQASAPLEPNRIRLATGLGVCSHCHKRLTVHQSAKGCRPFYRCSNQGCPKRYVNRVKEADILEAACSRLQLEAAAITTQAQVAVSTDGESEAVKELRGRIQRMQSLNDEAVAPVIAKLERELEVLQAAPMVPSPAVDWAAVETFFGSPDGWERMAAETPAELRQVLLAMVAAVLVRDGEIEGVVLASELS